ncbi:MAG: ABC transporter permease [Clostridiales Family XIII bacterium]|jgi:ABC-type transport system involved in multi-copper enzyme maturation permease subunit|nr:ABC transporter permease [Clostridiales Family XIII bacterium]
MKRLMAIELKKNNLRPYFLAALGITIAMFGFLYLFAGVEDEELSTYADVTMLVASLSMACYCVLGAVMFARFAIEEYKGRRAVLIFSYPVSRVKVLLSKALLVCGFILAFSLLTNLIVFGFFNVSEYFAPLVHEGELSRMFSDTMLLSGINGLLVVAVSLIALAAGLWRESVPVTIVTAVVICSVFSSIFTQAVMNSLTNIGFMAGVVAMIAVVAVGVFGLATKKVNGLEA